MFMINYELVYGKQVLQSTVLSSYESSQHRTSSASDDVQISSTDDMHSEETSHQRGSFKDRLMGAAGAAAVVAGGLAKGAVEAAKSEETAARAAAFKAKAHAVANGVGTSVSEIGDKAAGFVSSHHTKPPFAQADVSGMEEQICEELEEQEQALLPEEYESDEDVDEEPADSFADVEHMPRHNQAPRSVHYSETVFTRTYGNDSWESAEGIRNQSTKKSVVVGIISGLSVCIIFAGGLFGGMYLMKNNANNPDASSHVSEGSKNEIISMQTTTEKTPMITTTSTTVYYEIPSDIPDSVIIVSDIGYNEENIYSAYLDIINGIDFTSPMRGFLSDMNDDGIDELILPTNGHYTMYYYSDSSIKAYNFGSYMALDNFVMYQVSGDNGDKYLYYRDNYSYKSMQGYFSIDSEMQLNILIDYPFKDGAYFADWEITYNDSEEYANGYEGVDTFYGQPYDCHNKLLSSFKHYNYSISESSDYNKIKGLYYDELVSELDGSMSNAPVQNLGDMYNLFYFKTLCLSTSGCLADLNGDSVDELILYGYGDCFVVQTYYNGIITESYYDTIPGLTYSTLWPIETVSGICKQKAIENGCGLNADFTADSYILGYTNTNGGKLNLRTMPSARSEMIVQIPNHTFFNIYDNPLTPIIGYDLPDWVYVGVIVDGKQYYGYISIEYTIYCDTSI